MAAQCEQAPMSKRRKVTGKACAVAECTGRQSDGISLHKFPQNPQQRQHWTNFVRTCRADFGSKFGTPNDNSYVCERHFTSDAYPLKVRLSAEFGIPKLKTLNPGAVPTIQKHLYSSSRRLTVNNEKSRPTASGSTTTVSTVTTTACSSATTTATTVTTIHSSPIPSALPGISTVRGAYAKRERKRVIADLLLNNTCCSDQDDHDTTELVEEPSRTADASFQTEASIVDSGGGFTRHGQTKKNAAEVYKFIRRFVTKCNHPPLDEKDQKKKWIKPGSRLSSEVADVLNSRQMLKDVAMLSTGPQTASIEGFHSVLNHFAPKMFGFSFKGMHQRAKLAALHFNCNSNREQATAKDGSKQFNLSFKKGRKEFHVQEIKVGLNYCYVDNLMRHVTEHAKRQSITECLALLQQQDEEGAQGEYVPPPLCSAYDKPEKAEAVKKLLHRFNVSDAVVNDIRQKCKESFS